jgi:hypothetical protein
MAVAAGLLLCQGRRESREKVLRRVPRPTLRVDRFPLVQALGLWRFIHSLAPEAVLLEDLQTGHPQETW